MRFRPGLLKSPVGITIDVNTYREAAVWATAGLAPNWRAGRQSVEPLPSLKDQNLLLDVKIGQACHL